MATLCDFLEKQLNQKVNVFEYKNQEMKNNQQKELKSNQHIISFDNKNYVIEIIEKNNIENISGYTYLFFQNNLELNVLEDVLENLFDSIKIFEMDNFIILASNENLDIDSSIIDFIETETYKNTSLIKLEKIKNIEEFNFKFDLVKKLHKFILKDKSINKISTFNDLLIYEIIKNLDKEFLETVNTAKFKLIDETLINTGISFIENDLNISKTSNNLYLHRNTLSYRLDKIKEIFDLDLKNFKDALIFYISAKNFLYFNKN